MEELVKLEQKVQSLYEKILTPISERLGFDLPQKKISGFPTVLFLGNHSSGKSTFINFLLGAELQKTGLAPTDDGFTIITHGDKRDEFDGQTVVTHPDLAYEPLQRFGPAFLARLRLKTFPHELLKSVTLIDSPGMIDAAGATHSRGYDFAASVRYFAESADLILFFFDPDKPGTTGETVSIFTQTLAGLEYKLLLVLNKVDQFATIRDFARTYGTLCWNLSKTIQTKDIPHIFNTFIPQNGARTFENSGLPLRDFELSRQEVEAEIQRAPTRRADNLVSDLFQGARKLAMHARVCQELAHEYRRRQLRLIGTIAAILLATAFALWLIHPASSASTPWLVLFSGLTLGLIAFLAGRFLLGRFKDAVVQSNQLDRFFQAAFQRELGLTAREDLQPLWQTVKKQTSKALPVIRIEKLPYSLFFRRAIKKLDQVCEIEVPRLRRDLGPYHTGLRQVREQKAITLPAA